MSDLNGFVLFWQGCRASTFESGREAAAVVVMVVVVEREVDRLQRTIKEEQTP